MTSSYCSSVRISSVPTLQNASGSLHHPSVVTPSPYYHPTNTATHQSLMERSADQNNHAASTKGGPVYTVHTYGLKEYAYVFVNSHADHPQDTPVIYGEETTGTVQLPHCRLQEVQSIIVEVRLHLVRMIAIELYIHSCGRSIPIPRNRRIRPSWCCYQGKLSLLMS